MNYALQQGNAVPAVPAAATQAQQEAASATNVYVSPGTQQFHPSAAKFWAFVTVSGGTNTLQASYNVTSMTDNNAGDVTITIATDFSSANWPEFLSVRDAGTNGNAARRLPAVYNKAAGTINVAAWDANGGASSVDPLAWSIGGFGDQ